MALISTISSRIKIKDQKVVSKYMRISYHQATPSTSQIYLMSMMLFWTCSKMRRRSVETIRNHLYRQSTNSGQLMKRS